MIYRYLLHSEIHMEKALGKFAYDPSPSTAGSATYAEWIPMKLTRTYVCSEDIRVPLKNTFCWRCMLVCKFSTRDNKRVSENMELSVFGLCRLTKDMMLIYSISALVCADTWYEGTITQGRIVEPLTRVRVKLRKRRHPEARKAHCRWEGSPARISSATPLRSG